MLTRFGRSFLGLLVVCFIVSSLLFFHAPTRSYFDPLTGAIFADGGVERQHAADAVVHGSVIMPKLENATAKAELGRATWRLMHTMTLRFPEEPTQDERDALSTYFHLQARLYPCGDCAAHFQTLLAKYPPQTATRKAASNWLCFVHNQVNARLGKDEFDCAYLGDTYDCGCGEEKVTSAGPAHVAEGLGDSATAGMVKGGRR